MTAPLDAASGARTLAARVRQSSRAVALTGAGVSTDSGIPDFRSSSGLWAQHDPMRLASLPGFVSDPAAFYVFWRERLGSVATARPNAAHRVLAQLESRGLLSSVMTQNIDGLHQLAGSRRVLELHGTFRRARCLQCGNRYDTDRVMESLRPAEPPTCDLCGGLVKPDVVLFGERLPASALREAEEEAERCDLMIALGTSLEVSPVCDLVPRARDRGAEVVIITRDETAMDDVASVVVRGELRDVIPRFARELALPG